jgi:hypothetical protein
MEYSDTAGPGGIAKLKWPVTDTKPTLITTTTSENIQDIIQAANPTMNVMYLGLLGATDYGSCFFGFWDDAEEEDWIAEIGSSYTMPGVPGLGNSIWRNMDLLFTEGATWIVGGMSPSTETTATGIVIEGYADSENTDIRIAVYIGGGTYDYQCEGATLLWDAGILSLGPQEDGYRWEIDHPSGSFTIPPDTKFWIWIKTNDPAYEIPVEDYLKVFHINSILGADYMPTDPSYCGDFFTTLGVKHLFDTENWLIGDPFPATIPGTGVWQRPPFSSSYYWPIVYLKYPEESSSSSISISADPEASGWKFLRLISAYRNIEGGETHRRVISNIDACENNVYMITPSTGSVNSRLSDDFTGSNGTPPNSSKWQIISGVPEIQNNKLELTQIGTAGTPDVVMSDIILNAAYKNHNVEIEVDYELINYSAVESWWVGISIYYINSMRARMAVGWRAGQYRYQLTYWDGSISNYRIHEVALGTSAPISGKLKLEVYGSDRDVYGYYWSGTDWVLVGSSENYHYYSGDNNNFRLGVTNLTPLNNITWRADNYTVKICNMMYCTISVYGKDSYNSTTKKFETRTAYKDTDRYWSPWTEVYPLAAGTGGCAVTVYKAGWYWYDQPFLCYSDLVTYDSDLNPICQSNYQAEYVLGEFCGWQRDITDGFDMYDFLKVEVMCGSPPDYLFIVGTSGFLDGNENSYQGLIEIDATTHRPLRLSILQTTDLLFDGSEIQDAIAIP